jgi:YD repeat-containing protein
MRPASEPDTLEDYVYDPQGNVTSVHDGSANLVQAELYTPQGRNVATMDNGWNGQSGLYWHHAD